MITIDAPARGNDRYPIYIGALADTVTHSLHRGGACITDRAVHEAHGERLAALLPRDLHLLPEGEAGKSWDELQRAIAFLAARGHRRSDPIIALGGGSVGDLAGLVAALYQRGCPVVQVPTTLLAMVDSSVGGKTAIDAEGQKNLVGAFHPPISVHIDPAFLTTLGERELRAGLAETVKYGIIGDAGFYDELTRGGLGRRVLTLDDDACVRAISTAVRAKAAFVRGDLDDTTGRRALLNFGHSFGHAIEAVAGIGSLLHGEAVAIGMVMAADFSATEGLLDRMSADRVRRDLTALGLPVDLSGMSFPTTALFDAMMADKKNVSGGLNLVLLRSIGDAFFARDVDPQRLRAFLGS